MTASAFGNRPSKRPALIPRPAGRGDAIIEQLHAWGYEAEQHPFLEMRLERDSDMRRAAAALVAGEHTHLVLTSRTAVEALAQFGALDLPEATTVVAVGPGTAAELASHGVEADVVAGGSGDAVVEALPEASGETSVLFPASAAAAPTVREGLTAKGYVVHQVTAYRPRPVRVPAEVLARLEAGGYGALLLTSPMIAQIAAGYRIHLSTPLLSIGTPTTQAARRAGLVVHAQSDSPTDEALAYGLRTLLDAPPPPVPAPPAQAPARPSAPQNGES